MCVYHILLVKPHKTIPKVTHTSLPFSLLSCHLRADQVLCETCPRTPLLPLQAKPKWNLLQPHCRYLVAAREVQPLPSVGPFN